MSKYLNSVGVISAIGHFRHRKAMHPNRRRWKCGTGKCGTNDVKFEGPKMRD